MSRVYIFGHQNPDTDSITSSISLSYLKNKLGDDTEPRALGHINKETAYALKYFGLKEPKYLNDVKLQIKNIDYLKDICKNQNDSINDVYSYLIEKGITGTPVVDEEGNYVGIVTLKDIAKELISGDCEKLNAVYENIINTIDAEEVLKFDDEINGSVLIAAYRSTNFLNNIDLTEDNILIVGDRHSIIEKAVEKGIKLLIVTGDNEIKKEHIEIAKKNKVNIIKTKLDSYHTSKLISLSNSIKTILKEEDNSKVIYENDYYDEFLVSAKKMKHNNYPVLNSKNKCLGLFRITENAKINKKDVMLVDHQETDQSVLGLDEANILEIVDHHKIGDINTASPINFRNMTVGSCNTIINFLYEENNIEIPKDIAGAMLSGILSDTLCLKSPTTTEIDRTVVEKLSKIAGVDYEKYAFDMFKAGTSLDGLTIEEVVKSDFKAFPVGDEKIAITQVMTLDYDKIEEKMQDYIAKLEEIKEKDGYKFVVLCVTDILKNGSYILYTSGAEDVLNGAFKLDKQGFYVQDMVSRKKQILPSVLNELV